MFYGSMVAVAAGLESAAKALGRSSGGYL